MCKIQSNAHDEPDTSINIILDVGGHPRCVNTLRLCESYLIRPYVYEVLAMRASNNGHVIDLFAGCLGQVSLLKMKPMANGVIVLSYSFATSTFKQSFLRMFNKDASGFLEMGFNATFNVQVCMPMAVLSQ